jgi:alkylated DNA nucleotide flippase Atl1
VDDELPPFASEVLDLVDRIPPARVLTYGDVAELVGGGGPRRVARVMSRYGGAVPWWRVLRADGSPAPQVAERALAHYRAEGTPLRPGGRRVDMSVGRWEGPPHA